MSKSECLDKVHDLSLLSSFLPVKKETKSYFFRDDYEDDTSECTEKDQGNQSNNSLSSSSSSSRSLSSTNSQKDILLNTVHP